MFALKFKRIYPQDILVVIIFGALAYLPFLGRAYLFDWDEINFAECAREMLISQNYFQVQIDFQPFWEKPPLFIWLQALCMKVLGINEFAARLPNAIFGIITLVSLYVIGSKQRDKAFGFLWMGMFMSSVLPSVYFKSGIIDPVFNYFIFCAIYQIIRIEQENRKSYTRAIYVGLFIGLAILTKGPVGLLIPMLTFIVVRVYTLNFKLPWISILVALVTMSGIVSIWVVLEIKAHGTKILEEFIAYQIRLFRTEDAGHGQPFFYHFIVFLLGCFPLSAFALRGQFIKPIDRSEKYLHSYMNTLFWVVMILFSIVKTKIIHYSSLLYFPGSYAAAHYLYRIHASASMHIKWDFYLVYGFGYIVFGTATTLIPFAASQTDFIQSLIKDDFGKQNVLMPVEWHWGIGLVGLVFLFGFGLSAWYYHRENVFKAVVTGMITMMIWLNFVNYFIVPKVQKYTQGPPVELFIEKSKQNCYLDTWKYKSYAHYFYGKRSLDYPRRARDKEWLLKQQIDKPVFIVSKSHHSKELEEYCKGCTFLYKKGGFHIYSRVPNQQRIYDKDKFF
ncbi:MAG: glycosyltransferase family 39 protein [Bacteroidia bacterium]|nr:glycosyltransferase family 39 protein [Bacteroidia bacterium]MDW8346548.1 glycosyltransferase family 39 protein [Bacteroidia bacterium]